MPMSRCAKHPMRSACGLACRGAELELTSPTLHAEQLASQLRGVGALVRDMAVELQHQSWTDGPAKDVEIANLCRAVEHLESAATTLAGQALPGRRTVVVSAASTVLTVGVF